MYGASIRPSRLWYWVSGGLLAAALACAVLAVVSFLSLSHQITGFQRVRVPGQATMTFNDPGGYLIYFEGPRFSSLSRTGTVRVLIQGPNGSAVPVSPMHSESVRYSMGGHSGQAVASFTITTPGRYALSAGQPSSPAPADIAVGRSLGGSIAAAVVLLLVAVLALGPAGLVAGIVTAVRRRRSRRRLLAGPPGMPPMGPPGPPGWAPPAGQPWAPGPAQPWAPHPGPGGAPWAPGAGAPGPGLPSTPPDLPRPGEPGIPPWMPPGQSTPPAGQA